MSLLRIGANGPLIRLANGGFISSSTTPPLQTAPGVVTTLAASSVTQTGLTLQWSASTGSTPIAYAVYQKLHSGSSYTSIGTTNNTTFSVTGLQSVTQYDFYVVASNSYGTAANGNVVSPTTSAVVATAPGALTITAGVTTDTTVALAWTAPTGTAPFTYTPKYKLHSASTYTSVSSTTNNGITIIGLAASSAYDFQVDVSNGTSPSNTSNVVQAATGVAAGSAPGPLTDLVWTQPHAIHPLSNGVNKRVRVGWFDPVGGIGPYTWNLTNNAAGNYSHDIDPWKRGEISVGFLTVGAGTDSITMQCVDARGVAVNKTVTINKTDGTADVMMMNYRSPNHNCTTDNYYHGPYFSPNVCGATWENTGAIVTGEGATEGGQGNHLVDPNTSLDTPFWGGPEVMYAIGQHINAGTYHVRALITNNVTNQAVQHPYTIQIVDYTPITYIEFTPTTGISTATAPGFALGTAKATTPNNHPTWALTDATNTLTIDATRGDISVQHTPTSTSPIHYSITVTDDLATYTQAFVITPAVGTVLPDINLTFNVNPSLNNHTAGQSIGAASVTGITGTKQWKLVDWTDRDISPGYNVYGAALLFAIDNNGLVTQTTAFATSYCAAQTYDMTIQVTDGVNTCTRTVSFNVAAATTTTTYHVGRGMAAAHPGLGFDSWNAWIDSGVGGTQHDDKIVLMIHADSDPDYYTNQSGSNFYQWFGPMRFEGVSLSDGTQARLGGPSTGMLAGPQHVRYGGSPNRIGDGDWEIVNLEFSGYHQGSSFTNAGVASLFITGQYGNVLIQNCRFRDNDLAIDTAASQSKLTVDHCEFMQTSSGVYFSGGGLAHGLYIGGTSNFVFSNNFMGPNCGGHQVKCRARKSTFTGNRIVEGLVGGGANQIDISNAGDVYIANNFIQKGVHPTNEAVIRYGMEGYSHPVNNIVIENNTIVNLCQPGGDRFGPATLFEYVSNVSPFDTSARSTATVQNNQYYQTTVGGQLWAAYDNAAGNFTYITTGPYIPAWNNNTALTMPPAIDITRPFLTGNVPTPHNFRLHSQIDANTYPNYEGVCQIVDQHQLRVAHTAATGTVLCNISATTDALNLEAGVAQKFDSTTTWAIDPTNTMADTTLNPTPWAPSSRYTMTTNSGGTGTLKVGTGMPSSARVDYVQVTATCGSNKVTQRYTIVVT